MELERAQMIDVSGVVYNRDHIVKVDTRNPEVGVTIYTSVGNVDSYTGEVAKQLAAFFSPPAMEDGAEPTGKQRNK